MTLERRSPPWQPWVLGGAAALLYLLTAQRQLYGDGLFFQAKLREGGEHLLYNHALFLPLSKLCEVLVSMVHRIDGERAMKVVAALAGGVGVGMTWSVGWAVLRSRYQATVCALLVSGMVGYWFHSTATELHSVHAACATMLLLALVRVVDTQALPTPGSLVFLGVAVALTPGSHVSGVGVGLPLVLVCCFAGPARRRYLLAAGGGLLTFAALYAFIMWREGGFSGFTSDHVGKHSSLFSDPSRIPGLLLAAAAEFGLYSLPAVVLVPAGLRVLFRTAPRQAWLCLAWLIAWPLIAWPVDDRAIGSYYLPTYPVQALLAVIGMAGVARNWGRALLAVLLAFAPAASGVLVAWRATPFTLESGPLLVAALCGAVLLAMAGEHTSRPKALFALPPLAFIVALAYIPTAITIDHQRDRVAAVQRFTDGVEQREQQRSLMIFLAINSVEHHHWAMFYRGAWGDEDRAFNPAFATFDLDRTRVRPRLEDYARRIDAALAAGRPVWMAGSVPRVASVIGPHPDLQWFFAEVLARYRSEVPAAAPPELVRLRRNG